MGKALLPLLGGTPAVWTTCVTFFQLVLVLGYLYAHVTSTLVSTRVQVVLHCGLLLGGLSLLAPEVPSIALGQAQHPVLDVLTILIRAVGLPVLAIAATAPLVQRWFSQTTHLSSTDPFFLYAASNAGSLLALLAYPFVVEPALGLPAQQQAWRIGYWLLVVLTAVCGWIVARSSPVPGRVEELPSVRENVKIGAGRRILWLLLALVPSSMTLGLTTYATTDVAAIPLFWVVPLGLYLATYVLAFAQRRLIPVKWASACLPAAILATIYVIAVRGGELHLIIPIHLTALFLSAYVCHARLYDDRPSPKHLTEYYLWIAVGGCLGGVFNTLIAPLVFVETVEYPLSLAAAAALRPGVVSAPARPVVFKTLMTVVPVAAALLVLAMPESVGVPFTSLRLTGVAVLVGGPMLFPLLLSWHPAGFALALAGLAAAGGLVPRASTTALHRERSFFGTYRIVQWERIRSLEHGTTNHGSQRVGSAQECEPTSYFTRSGPIGRLITSFEGTRARRRVGIAGLGIGALAVYAQPGQRWTFFELSPAVERIARNPAYFTYLSKCAPSTEVIIGDARLAIGQQPDSSFDLLILDAFSSDAVPVHLLTREALALYVRKLAPDGVIAFQVTNRHLNLAPILGSAAREIGLWALSTRDTDFTPMERYEGRLISAWVVVSRTDSSLGSLLQDRRWELAPVSPRGAWTDDHANVLAALYVLQGADDE